MASLLGHGEEAEMSLPRRSRRILATVAERRAAGETRPAYSSPSVPFMRLEDRARLIVGGKLLKGAR